MRAPYLRTTSPAPVISLRLGTPVSAGLNSVLWGLGHGSIYLVALLALWSTARRPTATAFVAIVQLESTFHADASCRRDQCPAGFFTVVTGKEGIVHTVPDAPNRGYMLMCTQSGNAGFFITCTDAQCNPGTEESRTAFRSGQW